MTDKVAEKAAEVVAAPPPVDPVDVAKKNLDKAQEKYDQKNQDAQAAQSEVTDAKKALAALQ